MLSSARCTLFIFNEYICFNNYIRICIYDIHMAYIYIVHKRSIILDTAQNITKTHCTRAIYIYIYAYVCE